MRISHRPPLWKPPPRTVCQHSCIWQRVVQDPDGVAHVAQQAGPRAAQLPGVPHGLELRRLCGSAALLGNATACFSWAARGPGKRSGQNLKKESGRSTTEPGLPSESVCVGALSSEAVASQVQTGLSASRPASSSGSVQSSAGGASFSAPAPGRGARLGGAPNRSTSASETQNNQGESCSSTGSPSKRPTASIPTSAARHSRLRLQLSAGPSRAAAAAARREAASGKCKQPEHHEAFLMQSWQNSGRCSLRLPGASADRSSCAPAKPPSGESSACGPTAHAAHASAWLSIVRSSVACSERRLSNGTASLSNVTFTRSWEGATR
mmetsp:Transcript_88625/g.271301  ORF Transcript_88625/g.271301 Transcript_88625/m.271301 type:complete len:323 (+) Transcript_88625:49-1017(+)